MASVVADHATCGAVEPLAPPPPPPPSEQEGPPSSPDDDGTRVFGEGKAAASALASWAASASRLPPLRALDLRFSDEVDGSALARLGGHARGLTSLRLDGCRNVVATSSVSSSSSSSSRAAAAVAAAAAAAETNEHDDKEEEDGKGTTAALHHSAPELTAVLARASKNLRSLSLYWIPRLPSDVVYAAAAACNGLTSLNLSGCTRAVDDNALLALAASLGGKGGSRGSESGSSEGLRRLDLTRCQLLTDRGMARAFKMMPQLRELRLYAVESFGDEAARALAAGGGGGNCDAGDGSNETEPDETLSELEVLDVCGARDLSDAAAAGLVTRRCGSSLRILGCGWVPRVGDLLAKALGESCSRSLESLSLHGNRDLTEEGFDALVQGLESNKKLRALDVRGCVGVPEARRSKEALRAAFGEQLVEFALQR